MSKLNPQNATAYVGPGVLRKGGKITKVPNGPLVKKKGPFKGSTLKSGGKIPKAQAGKTWQAMSAGERGAKKQELVQKGGIERFNQYKDSVSTDARGRAAAILNKDAANAGMSPEKYQKFLTKRSSGPDVGLEGLMGGGSGTKSSGSSSAPKSPCKGGICSGLNKSKNGSMIKRKDGSTSKRGLWDNLRSKAAQNKKTGAKPKAPTKQMLVQEKKIKAKSKK